MRSFQVATVEQRFDTSDGFTWTDCHALTCRPCADANGEEETAFVPDVSIKVGTVLHCPYCGEPSIVPKKARWS